MNSNEQILLKVLAALPDQNAKAVVLQGFISEFGPLSEETGAKVRELLTEKKALDAGPGPGREHR